MCTLTPKAYLGLALTLLLPLVFLAGLLVGRALHRPGSGLR